MDANALLAVVRAIKMNLKKTFHHEAHEVFQLFVFVPFVSFVVQVWNLE
jgi:hypothetical protein